MASLFKKMVNSIEEKVAHRKPEHPAPTAVEALALQYTGKYAFLDELTHKTHQLMISPALKIKIDGSTLPGTVTGITTDKLTFLDHYGYQLIITADSAGPATIYDEAEDATYQIIKPTTDI